MATRQVITNFAGKALVPGSNAYKAEKAVQRARIKKIIDAATHGENIYVYNNVRTHQVIYSLSGKLEVSPPTTQLHLHRLEICRAII